jgi:cell division septum initiation protein DivIVA
MLNRATNRLVVSRMNKPDLAEGFANEIKKAPDANWMLQPTINSAPVGFLPSKCEMAQKTADDTIAAAKAEADALLAEARAKAGTMTTDLEGQRKILEDQVAQLRTYERNYRSRLRDYIQGQLANLDNLKADASVAPEGAPEGPPLQA